MLFRAFDFRTKSYMLKNHLACFLLGVFFLPKFTLSQPCTPQGDQITYGTNNVWIGYVYDNQDFTSYLGYINAGTAASPNFSEDFGGAFVNYPVNGCTLYTEAFTVRYKLTKTFAAGSYTFMVSGDDAIRFSIDGGVTWVINNWGYNGYHPGTATLSLNGTYNMVIEYLEGTHQNRIFFSVNQTCTATGNTSLYGSSTTWNGYVYAGINFEEYKGMVTETTGVSLAFNQNFGGSSVYYPTSDCSVLTDFFSVRYRMHHNFPPDSYTFTVSGDDKYRLSLDGGSTWVIDRWNMNTGNTTRMYTSNLSGAYDMVLEYYDMDGSNNIQLSTNNNILLPLSLTSFTGRRASQGVLLNWKMDVGEDAVNFEIERSDDGTSFQFIGVVAGTERNDPSYSFTDISAAPGSVYYRIKIIDQQGRVSYSKSISLPGELKDTRIYPTIVSNNTLYLTNDHSLAGAILAINDMSGRSLIRRQLGSLAPGQTTSVYISDLKLQRGIYLVQLLSNGQLVKTERIIIP